MKKSRPTECILTIALIVAVAPYLLTACLLAADCLWGTAWHGDAGNLAGKVVAYFALVGGGLVAIVVVGRQICSSLFRGKIPPWRELRRDLVILVMALAGFPFFYIVSQSLPEPNRGIWEAVRQRRVADVRSRLIVHPELATVRNDRGDTLLHDCDNTQIAAILLSCGADVNAKGFYGTTPLHSVSTTEYGVTMIPYLVSKGADVNAVDINGDTPLHYAAIVMPYNVDVLLKAGAKPDARNFAGETPRELAQRCARDKLKSRVDEYRAAIQAIDAVKSLSEKPCD